jgi:hypothetical protein
VCERERERERENGCECEKREVPGKGRKTIGEGKREERREEMNSRGRKEKGQK